MHRFDIQMKKESGSELSNRAPDVREMIEAGQVDADTTVIEIGPGLAP